MVCPIRDTTSRAEHFRNTSPTNSVCEVEVTVLGESGKCQGLEKVSVSARCCSAITRRDIRYNGLSVKIFPTNSQRNWKLLTERRIVFMNLSMSSAFIKSLHSSTPIASFGITVRCSCNVWLIFLQNFSLSSKVLISRTLRSDSKAL